MKGIKFSELKAAPVICGLLFSVLGLFIYWKFFRPVNQSAELEKVIYLQTTIPKSSLLDVKTSQEILFQEDNRRILLIYFATGCGACKKEFDLISQNYSEISSKVKLYGVSFEQEEAIEKFASENKVAFPLLIDKGLKLSEQLQVRQFPTNLIIENGTIRKKWIGTAGELESLMERIID